jgi:large subunit ribosomal protein L21
MKFAIIKTGGKQYRVEEGTRLSIEKLSDTAAVGDKVTFSEVLLTDSGTDTKIGAPFITGAKVEAEVIEVGRGKKIQVIHYKAKSRRFKRAGHRQPFTKVKISKVG